MEIKILFFGDIVGRIGRKAIAKILPEFKRELNPDLVLANAENLAHGLGVTQKTLNEILGAGVDFLTSGNHIWQKEEAYEILAQRDIPLIRPANFPQDMPGKGYRLLELGTKKILIINLVGRAFIEEESSCPFKALDEILQDFSKENLSGIIVDFHGEATSEKVALGWYADGRAELDGRVSAVLGTHTHIPTIDLRILPQGTGYITDIGMVGAKDSVIGMKKENIIKNFLYQTGGSFELPEEGIAVVNSVFLIIDSENKKTLKIKRVDREIKV